jgi:hypothetical protein
MQITQHDGDSSATRSALSIKRVRWEIDRDDTRAQLARFFEEVPPDTISKVNDLIS